MGFNLAQNYTEILAQEVFTGFPIQETKTLPHQFPVDTNNGKCKFWIVVVLFSMRKTNSRTSVQWRLNFYISWCTLCQKMETITILSMLGNPSRIGIILQNSGIIRSALSCTVAWNRNSKLIPEITCPISHSFITNLLLFIRSWQSLKQSKSRFKNICQWKYHIFSSIYLIGMQEQQCTFKHAHYFHAVS